MTLKTSVDSFQKYGAVHVKDAVSKDVMIFLTEMLMMRAHLNQFTGQIGDEQIPKAKAVMGHDHVFDCLLERLWPAVESVIGEELIPTYSYARLYSNKDELKIHTDRPSCEVSMTIQLSRTHNYSWPIFMGNKRFDLAEGDAVIYKGCEIEHWRNPCDGPDDYLSGQVFLHYVRKNGKYSSFAGDQRWKHELPFIRGRHFILENK